MYVHLLICNFSILQKLHNGPTFVPVGERISRLRPRASRTDDVQDQLDSCVHMDENEQNDVVAPNARGTMLM